jgi:hypothetical protein
MSLDTRRMRTLNASGACQASIYMHDVHNLHNEYARSNHLEFLKQLHFYHEKTLHDHDIRALRF